MSNRDEHFCHITFFNHPTRGRNPCLEIINLICSKGEKGAYSSLPAGAVLGNMCGVVIICFIFAILFIIQRADWKRPVDPEEEAVSVHFRTLTGGDSDSD